MRGTRFLWTAAGCPFPLETDGTPIVPNPKTPPGICAACGEIGFFTMSDAISDSFTTVRNASKAWAYGGATVCAACVWACKTLALRCSMWFARSRGPDGEVGGGKGGVCFVPLRGALDTLLHPPPSPFIVGLPLYGIRHGGENHLHRTVWWDEDDGHPLIHANPLVRLQSKHVALYATIAQDARVYPLQVDDAHEVMVDVELWEEMRERTSAIAAEMTTAGVWPEKIRSTLISLSPPPRFRIGHAAWEERVAPFRKHHRSFWWSVFIAILPIEEIKTNAKPRSI